MQSKARALKRALKGVDSKYAEVLGWIPNLFESELFREDNPLTYDQLFQVYNDLWVKNSRYWNGVKKQKLKVDEKWFFVKFNKDEIQHTAPVA